MAKYFKCETVPMQASAVSLAAKQYYAVKLDSDGNIALCDAAGELVFGILQDEPAASKMGTVAISGTCKAIAGGTFNPGTLLKVTAAGKLDTAATTYMDTTSASATDTLVGSYIVAQALEAGTDGKQIGVKLMIGGVPPSTAA